MNLSLLPPNKAINRKAPVLSESVHRAAVSPFWLCFGSSVNSATQLLRYPLRTTFYATIPLVLFSELLGTDQAQSPGCSKPHLSHAKNGSSSASGEGPRAIIGYAPSERFWPFPQLSRHHTTLPCWLASVQINTVTALQRAC